MVNTTNSVPILRFSDFHEKLKNGFISDFGYFYYGKSAPKHSLSENATTPCVRYGELYSKFNEVVDKIYSYTLIEHEKLKFSKGGEVLVPRVGEDPLGFANCSFLPQKNIAIGEMISVYNTNENGLFITYYFNAKLKEKFARVVEGGNVSNLYFRYLENIDINVPEIKEQNKIVEFLSSVDKKIQLLEKKKEQLELYKKAVMQKIFSQEIRFKDDNGNSFQDWEEKKLGDICFKTSSNLSASDCETDSGEYPVYGASGIYTFIDSFDFKEDYVAIVKDGSGVGNLIYCVSNSSVIGTMDVLRPRLNNDLKFLYYFLQTVRFKKFKVGSSIPHIYFRDYRSLKKLTPNNNEQKKIADFLSAIDNKIDTTSIQIDKTKEFKKGLLQQMFV